ncbi:MAG TPA: hypothetical protein VGV38_01990 [Pyrinomonadaceae bacterium]|nr:hypothetical protein [Pyrinomonadaceae bacterium]
MADTSDERVRPYVVIALSGSTGKAKKYQDCQIIPHGDPFIATHTQVYGPASLRECEKWKASHCDRSDKATG